MVLVYIGKREKGKLKACSPSPTALKCKNEDLRPCRDTSTHSALLSVRRRRMRLGVGVVARSACALRMGLPCLSRGGWQDD